ncbi:hypothetical protein [Xanthobacter aminoxidans]|uniref:hypothetical protein n=1 Tax=Xanthobacter aminoxidans TaxID=186280 RepID=UPI002022D509|nr:hypothetical protein [Xanthobacter aminoxidans]MCL8385912.1 hypothetical protein [Xanthobacter aminoxidans]
MPMAKRQNISALERLQSLPAVFRGADLTVRFQWTSKTASQYLYLWKRRGLVKGLGGHSDVFANLVKSQYPDWELAVVKAMPSAVIFGVESLRQSGWTTQIPARPTVAVKASHSVFQVEPYEIVPHPDTWFATIEKGVHRERVSVRVLRPAWALADMLHSQGWGKCGLWPDDVEWDEVTEEDEADWVEACNALGLQERPLLQLAMASP